MHMRSQLLRPSLAWDAEAATGSGQGASASGLRPPSWHGRMVCTASAETLTRHQAALRRLARGHGQADRARPLRLAAQARQASGPQRAAIEGQLLLALEA